MAQGKMKIKTQLPDSAKAKQGKNKKGPAIQRRGSEFIYLILIIYSTFS